MACETPKAFGVFPAVGMEGKLLAIDVYQVEAVTPLDGPGGHETVFIHTSNQVYEVNYKDLEERGYENAIDAVLSTIAQVAEAAGQ
jgi:hypothetical protein